MTQDSKRDIALFQALNQESGWHATFADSDEKAIELFYAHPFEVVILSTDFPGDAERKLRAILLTHSSGAMILKADRGLENLRNRIVEFFENKRLERLGRISVRDTLNVHQFEQDIRVVA